MSRTDARPDPMATAVSEDELGWSVGEMIAPVLSVPEAERASWYRSMAHAASLHRRDKRGSLAAAWCKIARATWPDWPPQDDEKDEKRREG